MTQSAVQSAWTLPTHLGIPSMRDERARRKAICGVARVQPGHGVIGTRTNERALPDYAAAMLARTRAAWLAGADCGRSGAVR